MKIAIIDVMKVTYDGSTIKDRGLGGSESAIVLMSKELAALGYDVTVFNNCIDSLAKPGVYDGVKYIDNSEAPLYSNEEYDIAISSRSVYPFFGNSNHKFIHKAKKRILWMHDTFCEGDEHIEAMLNGNYIDEIFTLSDFHTTYVANCDHGSKRNFEVLKNRIFMTRNGAVRWIDEVDLSKKDRNRFVYNASVTKGLRALLEQVWPEVKKRIPEAKLTVIGGYYRFREGAEPDAQEKDLNNFKSDPQYDALDVTFTGLIKQSEVARILSEANFMIYPAAFPETSGISTLESMLYRTPLITNRFGALEETAIDLACYKINYAIQPNSLFPKINSKEQVVKFVDIAVAAYHNTYLHEQKRQYCSIIDDIYGWDSIAKQWRQHFHTMFDIPLPVEQYREVSYINDKVARVYGRRFNNIEDRRIYKSYGPQQNIVVITPFYNASDYIVKCIESVAAQDYDNYEQWLIDDCSTDDSYEKAKEYIESLPISIRNKFRLYSNSQNIGAVSNQLSRIHIAPPNSIIMLLDGDDWLVPNNTIFHLYNDLYSKGAEFTYGSCWSLADNIPLIAQDYPSDVKESREYRKHKFAWNIPYTHLRTFDRKLFNGINLSNLKDHNGEYMKAGADGGLFYELLENANPKNVVAVKEIVCKYNDKNPLNDYKVNGEEQTRNAKMISDVNVVSYKKKVLIAVPTDKNVEPETFKSIYDQIIPNNIEVELQFFYGYRIDQIRNLISNWVVHGFDYLFAVDHDMKFEPDTLMKLLNADKDIATGLYRQRKFENHIMELYDENGPIKKENIPENQLFRVAGCGFGCVLVKKHVFQQIGYPQFEYHVALDHKDTFSEDYDFCKKARAKGFEIWADTSIKCGHIGRYVYEV